MTTMNSGDDYVRKPDSVGPPSPVCDVAVVPEDWDGAEPPADQAADPERTGELWIKGPNVVRGYWNRPEINDHRFRGGWWHTSDLGRREPDGSLTFIGTMTRMLKTGAENVFPVEVENCLQAHSAVADAAVIGVPNEAMMQDVKAVVVLAEGAAVTAEELIAHCKANIASYKKPKTIEFVDAIPRAQSGMKDYDALDARFGGGGYPGGDNLGAGR